MGVQKDIKVFLREIDPTIFSLPDEITSLHVCPEGAKRQIAVNAYERSAEARRKCIEHYGTKCTVCSFDFGNQYGSLGDGFIHVHHIMPLSEIDDKYSVDPIGDLRPVCPNCHAMIHQKRPAYSIEEVRQFIEQAKEEQR